MRPLLLPAFLALCATVSAQGEHPLADTGKIIYSFTLADAEVGLEEVEYGPDGWIAVGHYELMGNAVEYTASWKLTSALSGTWLVEVTAGATEATIRSEWKEESIASTIDSSPGAVHVERAKDWKLDQVPVCFENLVWTVYSEFALRLLDGAKGELPQKDAKVTVFLPASNGTFDVLLRGSAARTTEDGRVLDLDLELDGTAMLMTTTPEGLMLELRVPAQQLVVTLKGREAAARTIERTSIVDSGPWRERISKPVHEVAKELLVRIPMRDGVELAADVYRPEGLGKWPAILVRTPYDRAVEGTTKGGMFARRGYAVVVQDVRGRFDSEGEWFPLRHEERDGSDTIDWIAAQDWCDGNVGMIGASYVGWVQWLAAKSGNPHLKAIVPQVAPPDPLENIPYEGGAFLLSTGWWAAVLDHMAEGGLGIPDRDFGKALATLPLSDLDQALEAEHPFVDEWLAHPPHDGAYWDAVSYQKSFAEMDVAALHVTGWFDGDQPGALMNFPAMREHAKTERARKGQFLVVGPWGHAFNVVRKLGEVDFGEEGVVDLDALVVRFFDHYLKGADNGMERFQPVSTFTMGANRWYGATSWPLPETRFTELYLDGDGAAHSLEGDGRLELAAREGAKPDRYLYDPEDLPDFPNDAWDDVVGDVATMDFAEWEDREDTLDYTSPPLAAPLEITGPIVAKLWVATDGPDTDFTATLFRREKHGALRRVAGGIQRVRYRKGNAIDAPVEPGEVVELTVDCWATSQLFQPGDRLVLQIASSGFPGYARNLNTNEPIASATTVRKATNTVYHDVSRPSHLLLPVIVRDDTGPLRFEER